MKRAALYVRVSTQEQSKHGLSVDSQIVALKEYCHKNNIEVADIYNDAGISARKRYTKRPELLRLIQDCNDGKIDIILITKLDRFFRSVPDYYEVMNQIKNIPWRAIWEDYETETANGVLKVNIMLSVAQSEADKCSERIRSVFDYKRAKGDYIGTACLGYKRENMKLVKDEESAPVIEAIFECFRLTSSVAKTQQMLKEKGHALNKETIRDILKKETYCGNANGYETYAYITWREHDEILRILSSRTCKQTKNNYDYIFSGLLKCGECGCNMSAKTSYNRHKDGTRVPCRYYSCEGKSAAATHTYYVTVSENTIESFLINNLSQIVTDHNSEIINFTTNKRDNSNEILQLQAKLERVGIRFEDGDLSVEEYRRKRLELSQKIKELQRSQNAGDIIPLVIPSDWQTLYNSLDNIHKRSFWKSLIEYIEVTPDTRLHPKVVLKCGLGC